jgi:hypothetical protein
MYTPPLRAVTFVLGAGLLAAACAPGLDETDDQAGAETGSASDFFGDDRVGDKLRSGAVPIPKDYLEIETLFEIGTKCKRSDSKEIYVVEEAQQRTLSSKVGAGGGQTVFPRAVITGCNTGDTGDNATLENSYSLFASLFTEPSDSEKPGFSFDPAELMALDRKTGLYNFYFFTATGVTRVFRENGKVFERTLDNKTLQATAKAPPPAKEGNRCFDCHVNGAPLMNELSDPWENWVSTRKSKPKAPLEGETERIVGMASLAHDLEQTIRSATCHYVRGFNCELFSRPPTGTCGGDGVHLCIPAPAKAGEPADAPRPAIDERQCAKAASKTCELKNRPPRMGFTEAVAAGREPGGIARLMRSLFCETEVNYDSVSTEDVPSEVFFDPEIFTSASLETVSPRGPSPFQFPVRSHVDKLVEIDLWGRTLVGPKSTGPAIRLVDDENDIFSKARCDLWPEVTRAPLPQRDSEWNTRVRDVLLSHLDGTKKLPWVDSQPARLAYLKALLGVKVKNEAGQEVKPSEADVDAAKQMYLFEVQNRQQEKLKTFMSTLPQREQSRKDEAMALFHCRPGEACGPMPILTR